MAASAPVTPVPYTKTVSFVSTENKTLRAELTKELSFEQMDTNLSKITRVNFGTGMADYANMSLFGYDASVGSASKGGPNGASSPMVDFSVFTTDMPFAVVNISGSITEVGQYDTNGNFCFLDTLGAPLGKCIKVPNLSYILTYKYNKNGSGVMATEISGNLQSIVNLDIPIYPDGSLSIDTNQASPKVFDLDIGITWLQSNTEGIIFNPKLTGTGTDG